MTLHLAHHLRPAAPRRDLPALHEGKVAELVASTGLPMVVYPTFASAVAGHYRRLRDLGQPVATVAPISGPAAGPASAARSVPAA
jgi:fatty acid desaturase